MVSGLFKKNNYLFVYLFVIGIINVFLLTLPLTNVFGYEFSAINSLLLSFLSGIYTISIFKSVAKEKKYFYTSKLFGAWLWMLFIPFLISVVNSIIFGFCSFWDGLMFYLVITCPSVIIGSAIGAFSFHFVTKFRIIVFLFLYLLILFIAVLEIYFNPQVYLYNPLFSYFPGTIYDEGISVDFKLILYRIISLIFFLPILNYFIRWLKKEYTFNKKFSFLIITIIITGLFYFFISPALGYTTTNSNLQNTLSNRIESEHFIIQVDKRIEKDELKLIVLNQEYYYSRLSEFFLEKPETKISSYIFYDSKQKKKLFGAGSADVAKPWLNSIYISADTWESTLKHEIAHCFTAAFGTGLFKLAADFNPALIEGMAEAADGFYDDNSINFMAALAYKNHYRINLSDVFTDFSFFNSVSSLSYIYSGSFIKYLVDEYGIDKVKSFYATNDFYPAFGENLETAINNFESYLDTSAIEANANKANYYFGRKPLISKVCPRYVASTLQEGWEYFLLKNYDCAESIFRNILSKTESYSAIAGLSEIYEERDSVSQAVNLFEKYLDTFEGTSSEYNLKIRLADLYVKESKEADAFKIYKSVSDGYPERRLKLLADTRLALIDKSKIEAYVSGSDYDKYSILKELNAKTYNYSSIPLMIDLSYSLKESYRNFIFFFKNDFEVKDEISSYAILELSEYMLNNFDYANSRKMAGFAFRYKANENLLKLTAEQYKKTEWFVRNAKLILDQTKFELN